MSARGWFVTGTDTGVGKTVVAIALLEALGRRGLRCAAMKPVAAGAKVKDGALRNADAEALREAAQVRADYATVNPYVFAPAIAPHIAAEMAGVRISLDHVAAQFSSLAARADCVVVEGAGGWLVPLDERCSVADLAARVGLPVILVVGMRLGCLNHALLTARSIQASGLPLAGWVGNCIDPSFACLEQNLHALEARLAAPMLGRIPWLREPVDPVQAAAGLDRHFLSSGAEDF
jgi:dethiobiotin synthetase